MVQIFWLSINIHYSKEIMCVVPEIFFKRTHPCNCFFPGKWFLRTSSEMKETFCWRGLLRWKTMSENMSVCPSSSYRVSVWRRNSNIIYFFSQTWWPYYSSSFADVCSGWGSRTTRANFPTRQRKRSLVSETFRPFMSAQSSQTRMREKTSLVRFFCRWKVFIRKRFLTLCRLDPYGKKNNEKEFATC